MSWTQTEWDAFVALLAGWWPGDFSDADAKAWRVALEEVEPAQAIVALKAMLHSGKTFRPSASELLAAVRNDPSQPTFDEAVALIYRAACFFGDERLIWLEKRSPLVASFLQTQGPDRVFCLPLDDPQYGEVNRRQLKQAWSDHCATADQREIAAIASGDRGLRRLNPVVSFDAARPELGLPE